MASKHAARVVPRAKQAAGRPEALKLPGLLRSLLDEPGRAGIDRVAKDRKSTRLNSSHLVISYAVFCLKKKQCLANNTLFSSPQMHNSLNSIIEHTFTLPLVTSRSRSICSRAATQSSPASCYALTRDSS